MSYKRTE